MSSAAPTPAPAWMAADSTATSPLLMVSAGFTSPVAPRFRTLSATACATRSGSHTSPGSAKLSCPPGSVTLPPRLRICARASCGRLTARSTSSRADFLADSPPCVSSASSPTPSWRTPTPARGVSVSKRMDQASSCVLCRLELLPSTSDFRNVVQASTSCACVCHQRSEPMSARTRGSRDAAVEGCPRMIAGTMAAAAARSVGFGDDRPTMA
mmetsp:Transcript_29333/g.94068  ORF Transcript_29333/g.94068 Transcript_29333/m.94068 type:complete len:212 (-) Transcript_29333:759-1394(-)